MVKIDFKNCLKKELVKNVKTDYHKLKALLKASIKKQQASDALPNQFPESKITLFYDALRIYLEYLALKEGLKIYNHECYTAFLKEVLTNSNLGDEFDKFRRIRNAINYYGKELTVKESLELIKQMKIFIVKIKSR